MTYTFKLARRLAVSRDFVVLTALVLLAACMGDTTAPDAGASSSATTPLSLQIVPRSVTIETNQRVRFRGQTRNSRGEPVSTPVAWGASGGSINPDGTFSSTLSGTFKVVGRGRGWRHIDTSVVHVVPPAADLARIVVTPGSVTLLEDSSFAFTVTGYLADGSTAPVGVDWSATGGSVDPSGVYTADSVAGKFRLIATNTTGTLADTSTITIEPPPAAPTPPTASLIGVHISPASVTLGAGAPRQFSAYGRTSEGDSVPVTVAFKATGGTITSGGLYTAGQAAGSYRVTASASGLADTAVVTLTAPTAAAGTVGIPFGPYAAWDGTSLKPYTENFTATMGTFTPANLVTGISTARAQRKKLLLALTGGAHENYMTDGVFDMAKWRAKMNTFNTPALKLAVAAAVADGTIIGNSVMDEPHVKGTGDGNTWGPAGTMTKARVDSLCGYAKSVFPTLPVGVVHPHDAFEPSNSYRVCEFLVDQYAARRGSVTEFRDEALAFGRRDNMAIVFSINVMNGGIQAARDGRWDCPLTTTGGRGTYDPNCRMTPKQVRDWGILLGSAGCAMVAWRYDSSFMANPDNRAAFADVTARLATLPAKSCGRNK